MGKRSRAPLQIEIGNNMLALGTLILLVICIFFIKGCSEKEKELEEATRQEAFKAGLVEKDSWGRRSFVKP